MIPTPEEERERRQKKRGDIFINCLIFSPLIFIFVKIADIIRLLFSNFMSFIGG